MILAIDIGNSNIVFGLHKHNQWIQQWREKTKLDYSSRLYAHNIQYYLLENNINIGDIEKIIISSVVPDLTPENRYYILKEPGLSLRSN